MTGFAARREPFDRHSFLMPHVGMPAPVKPAFDATVQRAGVIP